MFLYLIALSKQIVHLYTIGPIFLVKSVVSNSTNEFIFKRTVGKLPFKMNLYVGDGNTGKRMKFDECSFISSQLVEQFHLHSSIKG